jgi:hypothetical protein
MKRIKLDLSMNQPLDEWEKSLLEGDIYIQVDNNQYAEVNNLLDKADKIGYIPFQISKDLYEKLLLNAKKA